MHIKYISIMGRIIEQRDHKKSRTKNSYLIICEGRNKTEKLYFEHFKKYCDNVNLRIEGSEATDPKSMIKKAKYLKKFYGFDENDKVFCLIDIDNDINKAKVIEELAKLKVNKDIEIITSNANFETWYLLHFIDNPKLMDSKNTIRELVKYIPAYDKNVDVYQRVKEIRNNTQLAIARTKKLRKHYNNIDKNQFIANPYTTVDLLVSLILSNKK